MKSKLFFRELPKRCEEGILSYVIGMQDAGGLLRFRFTTSNTLLQFNPSWWKLDHHGFEYFPNNMREAAFYNRSRSYVFNLTLISKNQIVVEAAIASCDVVMNQHRKVSRAARAASNQPYIWLLFVDKSHKSKRWNSKWRWLNLSNGAKLQLPIKLPRVRCRSNDLTN